MTKHQLVEAAPKLLERVLGNDFRTLEQKVEFVDFLQASVDRAADNLTCDDCDLCRPLADLFGLLGATRAALVEEIEEEN